MEDYSTHAGMENGALLLPFGLLLGSLVRVFGVLGFRPFWPLACAAALWTGLSAFLVAHLLQLSPVAFASAAVFFSFIFAGRAGPKPPFSSSIVKISMS